MNRHFCKVCGKHNIESDKGDDRTLWIKDEVQFALGSEGRLLRLSRCGHCGAEQPPLAVELGVTHVEGYRTDTPASLFLNCTAVSRPDTGFTLPD